jgi:hypothetical protein
MPRWKARALALGEMQRVFNDAVSASEDESATARPKPEELRVPALTADEEEPSKLSTKTDPQVIAAMEQTIDALSARLDRLEKEREAENALTELEDAIEKEEEQSAEDCDTTVH